MSERLSDKLLEYLLTAQGKWVNLKDIRVYLKIEPGSSDDTNLRKQMSDTMVEKRVVSPSGRNDGIYKVIRQVQPVRVFTKDRERRPIFNLFFPKDFNTGMEMDFAQYLVIREGDLVTIGGVKSRGKTHLCLGLCAENIDKLPVLMGNEYTISVDGLYEPAPRFLHRLDRMSEWVQWTDENGDDKFTLLPVRDDYAEHIVPNRINIIDWINLDAGELYDIGRVLESIKAHLGRGIGIVALQKGEDAINPRGGQFVRDFSDVEILLNGFGDREEDVLLTVKGAKEKTKSIVGKTYSFTIGGGGTQTLNFREVVKCPTCYGKKWVKWGNTSKPCDECNRTGYVDK